MQITDIKDYLHLTPKRKKPKPGEAKVLDLVECAKVALEKLGYVVPDDDKEET